MVHEVALPSGRVLFEWKSLDHVDIAETHAPWMGTPSTTSTSTRSTSRRRQPARVRAQHLGGLQDQPPHGRRAGRLAASAATSRWVGEPCSPGSTTRATRAHNRITIFDDGAQAAGRAAVARPRHPVDRSRDRAARPQNVHKPKKIVSRFTGNMQALDNGNMMIGSGTSRIMKFGPNGEIALDARLPERRTGTTVCSASRGTGGSSLLLISRVYRFPRGIGARFTCRGTVLPRRRCGDSTPGWRPASLRARAVLLPEGLRDRAAQDDAGRQYARAASCLDASADTRSAGRRRSASSP